MDKFWGLTSTGWTAIYTLLTFGLLAVAITAAIVAFCQWNAAKSQIEDGRKAELEARRPYILVTAEESLASKHLFDLSIRNIGQRPALNVVIKIDPPPVHARETGEEFVLANIKMLTEPIAMVAPGQEMRAFWDTHIERRGRDDLPSFHNVQVSYGDTSGHQYDESSVIDLDANRGALFTDIQTVHTIGKTLDAMLDVFKGSSVLAKNGELDVAAVNETRDEYDARARQEAVLRERDMIETQLWAQQWVNDKTPGKAQTVADLTRRLEDWKTAHPELVDRERAPSRVAQARERAHRLFRRLDGRTSSHGE